MLSLEQIRLLKIIRETADSCQIAVYLVGGFVRDMLLGQNLSGTDLDFVVEGDAAEFAGQAVKKIGGQATSFPSFLTAKLVQPEIIEKIREIDFASARRETYPFPGSLPEVRASDIKSDLQRRDFSVNAMALPLDSLVSWLLSEGVEVTSLIPEIIDLFGGLSDLEGRKIRILHKRSFIDDPTRIFRACRYAVRISGELEEGTDALITRAVASGALETVDHYRVLKEIKKIFREEKPDLVVRLLEDHSVLSRLQLFDHDQTDSVLHSLKVLGCSGLSNQSDFWFKIGFRLFAYYNHDARNILTKLGLSKKKVQDILGDLEVVAERSYSSQISDQALATGFVLQNGKDAALKKQVIERGLINEGC